MSKVYPKSPYEKIGGLFLFSRMIDKIRLHAEGKLPADYIDFLGAPKGFDGRTCTFLRVDYKQVVERVKQGGTDEEILAWAFDKGYKPTADEIEVWNGFMSKRGWRDEGTERLRFRLKECGLENHQPTIETYFDFIDADEGRI